MAERHAAPLRRDTRALSKGSDIAVIGLGRFGSALALALDEMGHHVLAIDADGQLVQRFSSSLTHVAQADATNAAALRQLGVDEVDTVAVCIGSGVEASVLTAAALVELGVRNIWAKAITEAHGRILGLVGAHHVVFPEADMGRRVANMLAGQLLEYVALDEDFVLAEIPTPPSFVGINLGDSRLRATHHVTIVCVKPVGGAFTYATAETVLAADDLIVVAGHRAHVDNFVRIS